MGGATLSEAQAYDAMRDLTAGQAPAELIAGFAAVLTYRRPTAEELVGLARAMRERAIRIEPHVAGPLVDTCSTGGAPVKSFNIGTASAFVVAAAGAAVAKHGNRSVTRPSGSADVLQELGARVDLEPQHVQRIVEEVGFGFMLAPRFHPALRYAASTRSAFATQTIFNLLGPLCNPAGARRQVLGVFDPCYLQPMALALASLGAEHALVLHGGGMDEATLAGPTQVVEVKDGSTRAYELSGTDFGYAPLGSAEWAPLPPKESAREVRRLLAGGAVGPRRALVEYNAGLGIYVAGLAPTPHAGVDRAREILESDAGLEKLDAFVAATRERGGVGS
jgi:anthranilate phosphoribosyltransferase